MKIKKAQVKDLPFIKKLLKKNSLPYEDVSLKNQIFFIGYRESKPLGIGGIEIFEQYGLLRSLVIIDQFRGKGYGKILASKIVEYAREIKLKEVYLLTTTAKGFFKKLGFKEVNRNQVPIEIKKSTEFKSLCPSTAICMKLKI